MLVLERTLLVSLVLFLAIVQTSGNPWHVQLTKQNSFLRPIDPDALQQPISSNFTSTINTILKSFDSFGNTTKCTAKISQLSKGLQTGNPESVAFLDALGKPGPGVTNGNFLWLGAYEMCGKGALGNITTGYIYENCVISATLNLGVYPLTLTWTGCSPPECKSQADLQDVLQQIATLINKSGYIHTDPTSWTVLCDAKQEFDAGAYAAVAIISLFGFLVVVGTIWYLLEPIIFSSTEREREDTSVLVQAEEDPCKDVDKGRQSSKDPVPRVAKFSIVGQFIKCFALQKTMKSLFSSTTKPGQVLCLNGIRVLSINWVVLGHAYAFSTSFISGITYTAELMKRRNFMLVLNALPSVDSFFTLSGFLVTYLLLKQLAKRDRLQSQWGTFWTGFYVHRYLRLTMPYLIAMLIEGWLYRLVMDGPHAQQMTTTALSAHEMCKKYWYTNLLYVNNLVPWKPEGACVGQGWYLANDMQFFLIAPIFIVLLFRKPLLGLIGTGSTMFCSAVAAAVITAYYHFGPAATADTNPNDGYLMYTRPWIRITPYLVGILGGWLYWKWGEKISARVKVLPEWVKVACATPVWVVTAAVQYGVVFGLYDDVQYVQHEYRNPSEVDSVSYQSLARIAWSLSLTVQILLCQCGLGGFINSLLSWNGWLILSRLTYSVFLLHIGLQTVLFGQMRHAIFLNPDFEFAVLYLGMLAISYLSAAVLYLTVELPVSNLEGLTYRKK